MKRNLLLITCTLSVLASYAQTSADFMIPMKQANTTVQFDVNAEGEEYKVNWGMDAAWDWDYNVNRGVAYIGKGNFATGRVSFQPIDLVIDNGNGTYTLTERQQKRLKWRCDLIKRTGTQKVNINCDHEALFKLIDENGFSTDQTDYTGRTNYRGKPQEWYKLIKASVAYVQSQGLEVVSISPFNEPDYTNWMQSTTEAQGKADFLAIAQLLKGDSYFDGIRICGGNTLNNDKASAWYSYLKDYLDEGNTHQLAGSFTSYANFFTEVRNDGKVATADEMHNVGDAIVGVNYGMQNGIWWGFDSRARGQFCIDSNEGVRIGYGENRNAWMSAAVYRNNKTYEFNDKKGHEVHGYIGSSERQAVASSFAFASTTQDVYFNGYGPTRMYVFDMPGGKSGDYQSAAQINAERIIDITWGEDVASGMIDGTYVIVNKNNGRALYRSSTTGDRGLYWVNSTTIPTGTAPSTIQWKVYPSYTAGDISYWFIDNVTDHEQRNLNVLDNNLSDGAKVIAFNAEHGTNEQWYLRYVQDGYYYIINRLTNKYLCCPNSGTTEVVLNTGPAFNSRSNAAFLWRFQPIDAGKDATAPRKIAEAPVAKQRAGSIELSWTRPPRASDTEIITYIIARAEVDAEGKVGTYNTIGRNISELTFTDNTAVAGKTYSYKVRACDYAGNRSTSFSDAVTAAPLDGKALLCQLQLDSDLLDNTANHLNASSYGTLSYSIANRKSGQRSLSFNGNDTHLMLPYSAVQRDEMTIATWIYWEGGSDWQRIFDFGNSTEQYIFLCPNAGSETRFVMKDGGDEQILSTSKLATGRWVHIALTLKPVGDNISAALYIDGSEVAQKADFTLRPSEIAPSFCYIGRSMFPSDPKLKGKLDDFRVYNYALSADEVAALLTDLDDESKDIDDSYVATAIDALPAEAATSDRNNAGWYDLSGKSADKSNKGILIHQGKKYLNK